MSAASFTGLLIISVVAVMAPVLAASVKRLKLPSAVVEIVAGIIVGPSVLARVKINQPVNVVALLGLASLLLGSVAGAAFHAVGWVRNPFFLAITLSATSLGLVVPVLTDAGQSRTVFGQLTIAGATAGEFGAITLLSLFFSATKGRTASNVIAFGTFDAVVAAAGVTL